jgi:hypothetical protein
LCGVGTVPDPSGPVTCKAVYAEGTRQCQAFPTCVKDNCFGTDNVCNCDLTKCIFAVSATAGIRQCVTPTTDLSNTVSAEVIRTPPSTCTTAPPTPTEPVDKIGVAVNTPGTVSTAIDNFNTELQAAKTVTDTTTGTNLAADFSLVVVAIAVPSKNNDGSVKLSVLASFLPAGLVTKVTDDHKRIYCPIIVKLLATIGGFKEIDMGACTWSAQPSVKRQAAAGSPEVYTISSDANSQSVNNLYGSSAAIQTISFFMVVVFVIMSLFLF